jgi:hypothetical protein
VNPPGYSGLRGAWGVHSRAGQGVFGGVYGAAWVLGRLRLDLGATAVGTVGLGVGEAAVGTVGLGLEGHGMGDRGLVEGTDLVGGILAGMALRFRARMP